MKYCIHPEGQSCGRVRSWFDCLFSMILVRGVCARHQARQRPGDGGGRGRQQPRGRGVIDNNHSTEVGSSNLVRASARAFNLKVPGETCSDLSRLPFSMTLVRVEPAGRERARVQGPPRRPVRRSYGGALQALQGGGGVDGRCVGEEAEEAEEAEEQGDSRTVAQSP